MRNAAFSLVELLVTIAIISILGIMIFSVAKSVYCNAAFATSANNIRQLAVGGINYLADHNNVFWSYRTNDTNNGNGITWWFGFEPVASVGRPEGSKEFDPSKGPLGGYIPKGIRPDPSFSLQGNAFKPKFRNGYIGIGYNIEIGGGFQSLTNCSHYGSLSDPAKVVVFCTSAQINDFQSPASPSHPMIEEFYSFDKGAGAQGRYPSVHFRHNGKAMVSFATGNAGFLDMEESTRDSRMPQANVGRFAPKGDTTYLK